MEKFVIMKIICGQMRCRMGFLWDTYISVPTICQIQDCGMWNVKERNYAIVFIDKKILKENLKITNYKMLQ